MRGLHFLSAVALLAFLWSPARAETFTVSSSADSGPGTLRQAILDANASPGADEISFIVTTVNFAGSLPAITQRVEIDGTVDGGRAQVIGSDTRNDVAFIFRTGAAGSALRDIHTSQLRIAVVVDADDVTISRCRLSANRFSIFGLGADTLITDNLLSSVRLFGQRTELYRNTIMRVEILNPAAGIRLGSVGAGNEIRAGILVDGATGVWIVGNSIVRFTGPTSGISVRFSPDADFYITDNVIEEYEIGVRTVMRALIRRNNFRRNNVAVLVLGTGVTITENSISASDIPIDLGGDGPTPNDPAPDADGGANRRQNYPTLTSVTAGSAAVVEGRLESVPSTTYRIELFKSDASDPEAQTFVRGFEVTTDSSGMAQFHETIASSLSGGEALTATATNLLTGDTSEVSGAVIVPRMPAVPTLSAWTAVFLVVALAAAALARQ